MNFIIVVKVDHVKKNKNSFQKNHDWKLDFQINDKDKYLFLYRKNKVQQIEANFRLHLKNKNTISTTNLKIDYTENTLKSYYSRLYMLHCTQNPQDMIL